MSNAHIHALREALGLLALPDTGPARSGLFVWDLSFGADDLPGWVLHDCQYVQLPARRQYTGSTWVPEAGMAEAGCRLEITCHPGRDSACDELAQRLASLQTERARPLAGDLGELAYAGPNGRLVIWLHGNLVGQAAVLGPHSAAPLELALALQRFLLRGASAEPPAAPAAAAAQPRSRAGAAKLVIGRAVALPRALRMALTSGRAEGMALPAELPYPVPDTERADPVRRPVLRMLTQGGAIAMGPAGPDLVPQHAGLVAVAALVGSDRVAAPPQWHAMGQAGPEKETR